MGLYQLISYELFCNKIFLPLFSWKIHALMFLLLPRLMMWLVKLKQQELFWGLKGLCLVMFKEKWSFSAISSRWFGACLVCCEVWYLLTLLLMFCCSLSLFGCYFVNLYLLSLRFNTKETIEGYSYIVSGHCCLYVVSHCLLALEVTKIEGRKICILKYGR